MRQLTGMTRRDIIAVIVMPVVLLALTGVAGTVIAQSLQDRSFRRNELFRAKLEAIMFGHGQIIEIVQEVELSLRQIRSNEEFIRNMIVWAEDDAREVAHFQAEAPFNAQVAVLIEVRTKLGVLSEYDSSLNPSSAVTESIALASSTIDDYIGCVKRNTKFELICGDEHPEVLPLLNDVIFAYGSSIEEFVKKYE